jgi:hypothetical protein
MRYELPKTQFEELIAEGLWLDHEFEMKGMMMRVTSIGQGYITNKGEVIPVEIDNVDASMLIWETGD